MTRDWEAQFREWAKPPGKTEQDRCDNAVSAIRNAIRSDGTYLEGVELLTDKENRRIINWPEQHYTNGCRKNTATGTRFKSIVRALKALSIEMTGNGIQAADIPGFLIECLVWNVPDSNFQNKTYRADVRAALAFLFNNTISLEDCKEWGEVSDLVYLFHKGQKWTWQQAHTFTSVTWDYVGFGG